MNGKQMIVTCNKCGARNRIPTRLFVKNGKVVDTQVGVPPKGALARRIEQLISL